MEDLTLINNTSVYRNPAPQSPLQGANVLQPAAVYSKIMLRTIELAESDLVFDSLATERNMPSNNGSNEIVFKRMLSLAAHTQPLVEGIPPASDQGRMVAIKGTTTSYGRVMKFTDKVNWAVPDPLISEYTRQLSLKVVELRDILAQQALHAECQSFYAVEKTPSTTDADILVPKAYGNVTHVKYMNPDCSPTIDDFRKIVLSMEASKVRPYRGSNFLALVSSAVMFDLITDKRVKEFMKWTNTATTYTTDMVIDLFSLSFKKAKTIKTDNTYTDADGAITYIYHLPIATVINSESATKPANDITKLTAVDASVVAAYSGSANVLTNVPADKWGATTTFTIVFLNKTANTNTYASVACTGTGKASIEAIAGTTGYDVLNVHYSFVLGEECLYRIGVEGHTQPQFISKPLGSSGTEDPLNQRQSIGWKIDSLGYKVVNPDAVVAYMACPTQYKININARPDLRNQFTAYNYGYKSAAGKYYHPEQVVQTMVSEWDATAEDNVTTVKYFVRGTTTEVTSVQMTELVNPINGGRFDANGKKQVVIGTVPSTDFYLKTDASVKFVKDQVALYTDSKYYIKGLAGVSTAEVVKMPAAYSDATQLKGDGTGVETRTVVDFGSPAINKTGDERID